MATLVGRLFTAIKYEYERRLVRASGLDHANKPTVVVVTEEEEEGAILNLPRGSVAPMLAEEEGAIFNLPPGSSAPSATELPPSA